MVMAAPAVQLIMEKFPQSKFTLICKKGLEDVLKIFPGDFEVLTFNKSEYKSLFNVWQFGRRLKLSNKDSFISFPNSFSAALMALASGAGIRIGYAKEGRGLFLNVTPTFHSEVHRVVQYFDLIKQGFSFKDACFNEVTLIGPSSEIAFQSKGALLVSFNSEASSRRMPLSKAVSILNAIADLPVNNIILLGGPKDVNFNEGIINLLNLPHVISWAGKTNLFELASIMSSAKALLTVDSGPSHLANALRLQTVVMHGADDEKNTEAYNKSYVHGLRYGKLPCEPCVKNVCKLGDESPCLLNLDEQLIKEKLQLILSN